jgi:hypothetical protein
MGAKLLENKPKALAVKLLVQNQLWCLPCSLMYSPKPTKTLMQPPNSVVLEPIVQNLIDLLGRKKQNTLTRTLYKIPPGGKKLPQLKIN